MDTCPQQIICNRYASSFNLMNYYFVVCIIFASINTTAGGASLP